MKNEENNKKKKIVPLCVNVYKTGLQCFEKNVLPFLHVFFLHPTGCHVHQRLWMNERHSERHTAQIKRYSETLHQRKNTVILCRLINTRAKRACRICIASRFYVFGQVLDHPTVFAPL